MSETFQPINTGSNYSNLQLAAMFVNSLGLSPNDADTVLNFLSTLAAGGTYNKSVEPLIFKPGSGGILTNVPEQVGTDATYVYGYWCYNPDVIDVFLKFWNSAAQPEPSTDGQSLCPVQIPAGGSAFLVGNNVIKNFNNGCWTAVTKGYEDLDDTAPTVGKEPMVIVFYYPVTV
jgi:hypothetical protein